jgi:MraZ protein
VGQWCAHSDHQVQPGQANEIVFFTSTYRHGVDEKRRVQVPAKWRSSEAEVLTLILWPRGSMPDACLLVLPPAEWLALVQKLKSMPYSDRNAEALRSLLGRKSDRVTLDKAGRICLPEEMAKAAGIESEAVLAGKVDRFEIWNPGRYETASAVDDQLMSEAFKLI